MSKSDAEAYIRERKSDTYSVDEQVEMSHSFWDARIGPTHDGIRRADIENRLGLDLDHTVKTSVKHLVDIGMVEEFTRPGPSTLVIATWREDGVINGEVDEAAGEGVENLIAHMHDDDPPEGEDTPAVADGAGSTVRSTVADAFDLLPGGVEDYLRTGDQVEKLNVAVEAIEDNGDLSTRDDYGEIIFVNPAYRYRLTERAVTLYEREG